jgi:hypothetical protein
MQTVDRNLIPRNRAVSIHLDQLVEYHASPLIRAINSSDVVSFGAGSVSDGEVSVAYAYGSEGG